jgi:hypothetical protein
VLEIIGFFSFGMGIAYKKVKIFERRKKMEEKNFSQELLERGQMIVKNLTPRPIRVRKPYGDIIFDPEGIIPQVEVIEEPSEEILGVPTITRKMGEVVGLPPFEEGVFYIVSSLVFEASERTDLLAPDTGKTCVKDEHGNIVAVTRFVRK